MNPSEAFGVAALLVGVCGFSAKLIVEAETLDVLALCGFCVALGYLWGAA